MTPSSRGLKFEVKQSKEKPSSKGLTLSVMMIWSSLVRIWIALACVTLSNVTPLTSVI